MTMYAKRVLSWVLAMSLLISCGIAGLVLPTSAEVGDVLVTENFEGETTAAALKKWTAKGSVVEDPLNPGNKVLKINSKLSAEYTGPWGMKPDRLYKLTLKVYGGTGVYVRMNTGKGILNDGRVSVNTTAGWTQLTYFVKTTSQYNNFNDDAYTISLTAPAGAYVDDVNLVEVENDPDNLIVGGDFEEDASYYPIGAWKDVVKVGGVVTDPDDANNHVMRFEGYGNKYYNSRVGIQANKTYVLSFKAKGKNLGFYLNASKGIASNSGWKQVLDATGSEDWIDYKLEFRTKASVDDASYVLAFNLQNASNITGLGTPDAYIDDVRLEIAPAKAISMDSEPLYLGQGASSALELIVDPNGGKFDSLEWKSADETLVTVDADGNVTASAEKTGETTVTATVKVGDTPLTATRTVIVVGNAESFTLKEEAFHLAPGTKQPAIVVAFPVGARVGNLAFSSDNEAVATVDANGMITAVAAGTATITVKNADNAIFAEEVKDTLTVTVDEAGERVSGGAFDDAVSNATTNGVGTIATDAVDRTNKVLKVPAATALPLGGLTLNAGKTYKMTFKARGTDVTATVANATVGGGDVKTTLKADAWTSVTRYFTAAASAAVTLKGTAAFELDDLSIVELPEATGITMVPSGTLELIPDSTAQAVVSVQPEGAWISGATFTSSDETVVTVTADGKMTLVGKDGQSAVITATAKNEKGEDMTAQVTVKINEYANMLNNPGFEQGTTSWKSAQISLDTLAGKIVAGAGKDGSKGLTMANTLGKSIEVFYQGKIPLLPGTTYKLSYDYKTTKGSVLKVWSGTLGFGQLIAGNSGGEWKTTSKVFTTPTSLKFNTNWDLGVVIMDGATEEMAVDNVRLELYSSGVAAESIEMNRKEIRLVPGRTTALGVQVVPTEGDTNMMTWTSSDENVATVEYGVVKGVGKGKATITATTRNGKKATAVVTVSGSEVLIENGTFDIANDDAWTIEGSAAIADGIGVKETAGAKLEKPAAEQTAGKFAQTFKGLKPKTSYTLTLRYAGTGNAGILLKNGETKLVEKSEAAAAGYTTGTYYFTTGDAVDENTTIELTLASGNGPVYFDYILLTEDATLIDVVVNDIYWIADEYLEQEHQIKPGTELRFVVTVLNQGEDPITAGMQFDVDIQVDAQTVQTITFTAEEDIAQGGIAIVMGDEKWSATKGDHTISATANSTLKILEIDDTNNNLFQKSLRVADEFFKVPELAQQAGFDELIFNDEFDSLHTIDTMATNESGYKWYITRPYAKTQLAPDDYEIKDGILTMKNKDSQFNYGMATVDEFAGRGFSFNKGYLEFRFRIPHYDAKKSGGPAIWSFPTAKITEGSTGYTKQWVEMDWMEYWGITKDRPGGHYTISVHETIRGLKADGVSVDTETILSQHSAANRHKEGFGDGEWHTMAFLWLDDMVIGYTDGKQVFKLSYAEGEFPTPLTVNNATEDGTGAFAYMNQQYLALILGGSVDNPMEVDYIRVWSGVGSGFVPDGGGNSGEEGGEEGDEPLFDMAAADFVNNYCLDDYLEPIMPETIDEYSYQYVLMGVETWEMLSEERQAEINALMAEQGQPTFPELVEAAEKWLLSKPELLADYFVNTFFADAAGKIITEVTQENYMMVLASVSVFVELDEASQIAIIAAMEAYGLPSYEELLAAALAFAEADGLTDLELPELVIPETGEVATVWPFISISLLFACAVVLWATRKRRA